MFHESPKLDVPGALTRRAFLRDTAGAIALAGSGAVLVSCGGGAGGGGAERSGRPKVTFLAILPLTTLTFAPELLADAAGYFADQGIDVEFQSTHGSAQAIQLVLAGGAPLTRIGQIEAVGHAANRGAPIMNVGTVIKDSTIRFISHASAPLREPKDFVGKTVGIPSEGGETETTLDLLLRSSRIDPKEVERQVVGVGPGVFNLVEQGRIAGFAVSIDTAKILEKQQQGVVVLRPGEFIRSGAQIYMVSSSGLAEHREVLRKYLAGVYAALEFMIGDDGFDRTIAAMRKKYSFATLEDAAVAKDSLAEFVKVWTSEGKENVLRTLPDRWQSGYEELVQAGQAEPGKDPSQWFTNELLPA
ncbi:MAG TPA: ABC transporter substrate-binding protein [Gammaproteobacteria bacterium]|nr:ABC transporter substrate-binding protein [Gammaproteobacteria bacterium]